MHPPWGRGLEGRHADGGGGGRADGGGGGWQADGTHNGSAFGAAPYSGGAMFGRDWDDAPRAGMGACGEGGLGGGLGGGDHGRGDAPEVFSDAEAEDEASILSSIRSSSAPSSSTKCSPSALHVPHVAAVLIA